MLILNNIIKQTIAPFKAAVLQTTSNIIKLFHKLETCIQQSPLKALYLTHNESQYKYTYLVQ